MHSPKRTKEAPGAPLSPRRPNASDAARETAREPPIPAAAENDDVVVVYAVVRGTEDYFQAPGRHAMEGRRDLVLVRDSSNQHDCNAVAVHVPSDPPLRAGYVAKEFARIIGPMMDRRVIMPRTARDLGYITVSGNKRARWLKCSLNVNHGATNENDRAQMAAWRRIARLDKQELIEELVEDTRRYGAQPPRYSYVRRF